MCRVINIIDQVFGHWTVIKSVHDPRQGQHWLCQCRCGMKQIVRGTTLRFENNPKCKACGYRGRSNPHGSNSVMWKGCGKLSGALWSHILQHAKARQLDVEITIKDAWEQFCKQSERCALSNLSINFGSRFRKEEVTASLDRIDSSKGYTLDNIQWVHKDINKMKMNLLEEKFIYYCHLISESHKENSIEKA